MEESQNASVWRSVVTTALYEAVGRDVTIDDAFRLGKHTPGRNRPILVKLHSSWDRRAAVSGSYKLASTAGLEHLYISPDESLDTRRCRTLDRIANREEGFRSRQTCYCG